MIPVDRPTNLVDRGVRRRQLLGMAWLIAGIVAAVVLIATDASRNWRLLLIVPFTISANGFLQAREKTCVILAAVGKREVDDARAYADVSDAERRALRHSAVAIATRSLLIGALIMTALWWM
jgi:hypothetical protein